MVGEDFFHLAGFSSFQRFPEKLLGIGVIEILTSQAIDTG